MPRPRSTLLGLGAAASLAAAAPCDLYASAKTPCVAAHSTTRALYDAYQGPLYQVQRASDSKTADIAPQSAGGIAQASDQDAFCAGTSCVISIIYDQSGRANHLTSAPPGGAADGPGPGGYDALAIADAAPVKLNGQKVYGVKISPGMGYRNDVTNGIAVGDQPQGIYAILDGTDYNDACCFDYGNAETNNLDTGNGHMEAIYFGTSTGWGFGKGSGPWIMADLENGLFSGIEVGFNPIPAIKFRFVHAIVKGKPNHWSIRGADATKGGVQTYYRGARPHADDYNPMSREGAIILGIGGDNSNGAQGTFYEGVMTAGYPNDSVENRVHDNIVAAQYTTF